MIFFKSHKYTQNLRGIFFTTFDSQNRIYDTRFRYQ